MDNRKTFLIVALFFILVWASLISFFIRAQRGDFSGKENSAESAKAIAPLKVKEGIENPDISSFAFEVRRLKNGEILLAKNTGEKRPIASLTKLVSASVFMDSGGEEAEISISENAKKTEEKISKVLIGEKLFGKDLLTLLLLESANDAALAIAEFTGKNSGAIDFNQSLEFFVALMNKKTEEIGIASTTHFANPSGLDEENNFSTAHDISLIVGYLNKIYASLLDITRIYETSIFSESGRKYELTNTNILLKEFPAILGGKTGFTDEAGGALLVLYALKPDELVSVVILGSVDRFGDARKIINWLENKYD